jgi:periplasmic protein TonB
MNYAERQRNPRNHLGGIAFVLALHLVLIYALINGLSTKVVRVIKGPLETRIIQEARPPPEVPTMPPPRLLQPPPVFVPPPEINIAQPPPASTISAVNTPPPPAAAPAAPTGVHTQAKMLADCKEPDYPSASERLGESGKVVLALRIGTDGQVMDSKVQKSSGYPRLDKAALEALSLCKFTPASVDGEPVESLVSLPYVFKDTDG